MERAATLIDADIDLYIAFINFCKTLGTASKTVIFMVFTIALVHFLGSLFTQFIDQSLIPFCKIGLF